MPAYPGAPTAKDKSIDFLTHALAEVGFSPAHARRACLATNLAGVPQAIEWALAHLDEEMDPATKETANKYGGYNANPQSPDDKGLVVELPDGKLFKLKNPNGRVVEMPNSAVVEMLDGQVVEMSNGQQLEMVEGSLVEIVPAAVEIPDGDVVQHKILDWDASRIAASTARVGHKGGGGYTPTRTSSTAGADMMDREKAAQEEALRRHHMQVLSKEEQVSERDKAINAKQHHLQQQQQGLKAQEDAVIRNRAALQAEQDGIAKQGSLLKKKEQEIQMRETKLERMQIELNRLSEQLKTQERDIKERELHISNHPAYNNNAMDDRDGGMTEQDEKTALGNIDAGRIKFNELTLGSLLGSGSFADVYRAEWRMPCAVKKMKGRISKEQMTEFVREGEMMRSLKHPGIVKLLGVCVEGGSFYLVQEIVNGFGNLFDFLHKKNARLTYWQCVQIALGISDAMAYLHERHIVHRDLKPQNCLLVNEKGEVKLCDFGLARLKNTAFVETVSNTAGTPAYQAPEMLRDEPISEKVDLYGFGIMLWEMYTGKLPWSDKNYHQMIHTVAVRNERPPMSPDMPQALVQVIEGCWHPLPAKRPTFTELKATFKDLAKIIPPDVPKSTAAPPAVAPPRAAHQQQQPAAKPNQYYVQQQQQQGNGQRMPSYGQQGGQVLYGQYQQQQGW